MMMIHKWDKNFEKMDKAGWHETKDVYDSKFEYPYDITINTIRKSSLNLRFRSTDQQYVREINPESMIIISLCLHSI
jgi:hypothetical protein